MSDIEKVMTDLENVKDKYQQHWVLPFGSAYTAAHAKFKQTLASQAEWDKMKFELFMTAATIGFGAGMGAMFGKTALGAVAFDQSLKIVCDRSMTRTFDVMHKVAGSVPGTFIAGQLWDTVGAKLSEGVKAKVNGIVTGAAASAAAISEPQIMQNDLLEYVLRIKTAVFDVCSFVRDTNILPLDTKDLIATAIRQGPFMKNAPERSVIPDRQQAADIMELGFYMYLVMDSDYLVETTAGILGTPDEHLPTRILGPVRQLTSAADYGAGTRTGSGFRSTSVSISYNNPGSKVIDRINELHKARLGGEFFPNGFFDFSTYGKAEVTRAEATIGRLNSLVLSLPR